MQPFFLGKERCSSGKNLNSTKSAFVGAFASGFCCFYSKKEQEQAVCRKKQRGATYSQKTGCTLFALLNSIRGQGATSCKVRFIG
ncbi:MULTISPECIES: hypothetical protein [unclassified Pseudomonas]|uniref:hypothetical protein n=1 Tax=unclassified Pseudomonas TaxID=196821 RepID=UPI0015B639A8|nr:MULTISPECIES: hypothetical protein [unclassified Pseudomonas]